MDIIQIHFFSIHFICCVLSCSSDNFSIWHREFQVQMCLWANIESWVLHVDDYVLRQNRQKGQLPCKRLGISKHARNHEDMEIQCWTRLHNIICHLSNKSQPWPKKWLIVSPMKLHGDHLLVWDYIFWGKRKQQN